MNKNTPYLKWYRFRSKYNKLCLFICRDDLENDSLNISWLPSLYVIISWIRIGKKSHCFGTKRSDFRFYGILFSVSMFSKRHPLKDLSALIQKRQLMCKVYQLTACRYQLLISMAIDWRLHTFINCKRQSHCSYWISSECSCNWINFKNHLT